MYACPIKADDESLDFKQGDPITIEAWVRLDRISDGQNVYIVGKGRTHQSGQRDNQNYALRLRAVSRDARVSFLFRSEADETEKSDWHRWTSNRGFRPDGSWHHVAVSYQFGNPDSISWLRRRRRRSAASGTWVAPPRDRRWLTTMTCGSVRRWEAVPDNSFSGAIDEVVIAREIIPATAFADRRIVITHPPKPPEKGVMPGVVSVSLYEDVGSEGAWPVQLPEPLVEYQQTAFGIARIPMAYGRGGVRRDWKGPVMLTAMAEIALPEDEVEWCLRAGGLSRLWIGDTVVAETPAHLGNASGHGEVIRYEQDDPWLRPPRGGHFEEIAKHQVDAGGATLVTLQTMIGGDGLRYEPGEIVVAFRTDPVDQWQVLSLSEPIALTDDSWNRYAVGHDELLQQVDDQQRRLGGLERRRLLEVATRGGARLHCFAIETRIAGTDRRCRRQQRDRPIHQPPSRRSRTARQCQRADDRPSSFSAEFISIPSELFQRSARSRRFGSCDGDSRQASATADRSGLGRSPLGRSLDRLLDGRAGREPERAETELEQ